MSANAQAQLYRPPLIVKIIVSLVILFHLSAILTHVIAGGGPFVMRQLSSWYRPYLKTMWLDNAYRFYAPDPGPTEVLWYHLQYNDGSRRWTQVPRREDFYLRMPFQRHMSIALLGSMMNEREQISPKDNAASAASVLVNNTPAMRTVLDPNGEIYLSSFARHIARAEKHHPQTQAELVYMDCYLVKYEIRTPHMMRLYVDMYDPRMIRIQFVATFSPDGMLSNHKDGFKDKAPDDLFIELVQNEILPLFEENNKLPLENRKTIAQVLHDYGIPYPLIQPIVKMSVTEQEKFFQKPVDKDTLRKRYAELVKLHDRTVQKFVEATLIATPLCPVKLSWHRIDGVEKPAEKAQETKPAPTK